MGSNGKKKTTMSKLNRESRLRERRIEKQVRKDTRKLAPVEDTGQASDTPAGDAGDGGNAAATL
jgi:hypothetical protein